MRSAVYPERFEFPDLRREALKLYKYWDPEIVLVEAHKSGKLSAGCLNSMNLKSFTMASHSSCLEYRVNNDLTLWLCEKLDCSDGGALAGLKALAVDTGVSLVKKMGKTTLAACV